MRHSHQGRVGGQISFLRRQFLQEGGAPFSDVLSQETIEPALEVINACWRDRIYTPLVTLWVFLVQVISADHFSFVVPTISHLFRCDRFFIVREFCATGMR